MNTFICCLFLTSLFVIYNVSYSVYQLFIMIKFISYASIVIGLLVVIGAAGDDCGGDCIERAMPLADLMLMVAMKY